MSTRRVFVSTRSERASLIQESSTPVRARAPMTIQTLTIVGVGLIGGSIGLAAKKRGLAQRVLGVGRQPGSLEEARQVGAIDEAWMDAGEALRQSDVAVICTPVDCIVEQVRVLAPYCRPGTLLTDAGSTKVAIVRALDGRLPEGVAFVGSHPLAGSEKRGPRFADAQLFDNRLTVVTPTAHTEPTALERTQAFWQALGSRVRVMSPEDHDQALALTSHLPHLVASALAGILPAAWHELAATGFRDTTRIAAGDPSLWTGIFRQNRQAVLAALTRFEERLHAFQQALQTDDRSTLDSLLDQAKRTRDALGS